MDVDCDGVDFQCTYWSSVRNSVTVPSGNPDGQPTTSFGRLDSIRVPWIVIPESTFEQQNIPPNAISAIICGGRMYYGIMGDTNSDNPQVIGEASVLMAQTCFPFENLGGNTGHDRPDVLCMSWYSSWLTIDIVFRTEFTHVSDVSLTNFYLLKKLGDRKMRSLINALIRGDS